MRAESTLDNLRDAWLQAEAEAQEAFAAYEAAASTSDPPEKAAPVIAIATKVVSAAQYAAHMAKIAYHEAKDAAELSSVSAVDEAALEEGMRASTERRSREDAALKLKLGLMLSLTVTAALLIVGGGLYIVLRKPTEVTPIVRMKGEPLSQDESSAQVFCEENIRKVAKDPETVKVPFVRSQGRAGTHIFNWGPQTSMVRMRNGLGQEVAVPASCTVNSIDGKIISLVVDGRQVIHGAAE